MWCCSFFTHQQARLSFAGPMPTPVPASVRASSQIVEPELLEHKKYTLARHVRAIASGEIRRFILSKDARIAEVSGGPESRRAAVTGECRCCCCCCC
jgi:hypothetical protein